MTDPQAIPVPHVPSAGATALPDRGVVKVVGSDAQSFLQGLLTCSVETLAPGDSRLGALLAPQGKILFDFIVVAVPASHGGGYLLDTVRETAPALVKRLNLYKLRAKVTVEDLSETLAVGAVWGGATGLDGALIYTDPRLADLGERMIGARSSIEALGTGALAAYHARRIALAVPEGGQDYAFGDAFPHEADMDQLGGIDFKKGCYVGQEVVSRMQHRGLARTRLVQVISGAGALASGVDIMAGDIRIGGVGTVADGMGLGLVRIDRLGEALAEGRPVTVGGSPVRIVRPAWATFAFPAEGGTAEA